MTLKGGTKGEWHNDTEGTNNRGMTQKGVILEKCYNETEGGDTD